MHLVPLAAILPQIISTIAVDKDSVALIGMLLGVTAGWFLTGYADQLKAKKAKVRRKDDPPRE